MKRHKKIKEIKQDMKEINNRVKIKKENFNNKIIDNIEKERRTDEKRRRELYKQYENKVTKAKKAKEEQTVMIIGK